MTTRRWLHGTHRVVTFVSLDFDSARGGGRGRKGGQGGVWLLLIACGGRGGVDGEDERKGESALFVFSCFLACRCRFD